MACRSILCVVATVVCCLSLYEATPYNPHVPAASQRWFEGWYTRVTSETGHSFAAVTGSFPDQALPEPAAFAGILFQPESGALKSFQALSQSLTVTGPRGQPVVHDPNQLDAADFSVQAEDGSCNLTVNGLSFSMSFAAEGASLVIEGEGPVVSWGPNGESPEGPGANLPFIHLHWYVYSLATPVSWTFQHPQLGQQAGQGWAHMEKNWGRAFPEQWVWGQGMQLSKQPAQQCANETAPQVMFAVAGGPLPISIPWLASRLPEAWLIGYHSPTVGQWSFRPGDPTFYKVLPDACHGKFQIQATSLRRSLVIKLTAPVESFAPLQCPTVDGFEIESVESFVSQAHIEAFALRLWPLNKMGWELIDTVDIENVALEFGGRYRCQGGADVASE